MAFYQNMHQPLNDMPTLRTYEVEAKQNVSETRYLWKSMHIGVLAIIQWGIRRKRSKAQVAARLERIAGRKVSGESASIEVLRDSAKCIREDRSLRAA